MNFQVVQHRNLFVQKLYLMFLKAIDPLELLLCKFLMGVLLIGLMLNLQMISYFVFHKFQVLTCLLNFHFLNIIQKLGWMKLFQLNQELKISEMLSSPEVYLPQLLLYHL